METEDEEIRAGCSQCVAVGRCPHGHALEAERSGRHDREQGVMCEGKVRLETRGLQGPGGWSNSVWRHNGLHGSSPTHGWERPASLSGSVPQEHPPPPFNFAWTAEAFLMHLSPAPWPSSRPVLMNSLPLRGHIPKPDNFLCIPG